MPLGLMSIAAWARMKLSGEVVFELGDSFFISDEEMRAWLVRFRPSVVAISGLSVWADRIKEIACLAANVLPKVPIILGGPHATHYTRECLDYPGVEVVVRGEGEIPFEQFLEYAIGRRTLDQVAGIVRKGQTGIIESPAAPQIDDLDLLPIPAFDLIDISLHSMAPNALATILLPPHRHLVMHTSRGCPFRCTFCHSVFGRRFRAQSVGRVVNEIETLGRIYNVRDFHFYDDIFNANRRRLLDMCNEVVKRGLKVRLYFDNGLRTDSLDREQLQAMREAGVVYFGAAIETASRHGQKLIEKRCNVAKVLENVAIADELGIFTTGFLMLGVPGETREDMEVTIRTAETSRLSYAYFSVTNPYKGTVMGQRLAAQGVDVSAGQMVGYSSSGKNFAGIPEDEFRALVRSAYRRFWTPVRFARFLARHPDPAGFLRALAYREIRTNLIRRVKGVLGMQVPQVTTSAWSMPERVPELFESAASLAGAVTSAIARTVMVLYPEGEVIDPAIASKIGIGGNEGC